MNPIDAALQEIANESNPHPPGAQCPTCNGNDWDGPCAYPEGGRPGCLRDARLLIMMFRRQFPEIAAAWQEPDER